MRTRPGFADSFADSNEAELAQLAAQLFRHGGGARRGGLKIARRVGGGKIAPSLKRAKRPRRGQNHFAVEHQGTASDPVLVAVGSYVADALTAGDLAADHPVERPAVDELGRALRHHAGAMDMFRLFTAPALLFELLLDPFLKVPNRSGADAQLDQMQCHTDRLSFPTASITMIH